MLKALGRAMASPGRIVTSGTHVGHAARPQNGHAGDARNFAVDAGGESSMPCTARPLSLRLLRCGEAQRKEGLSGRRPCTESPCAVGL